LSNALARADIGTLQLKYTHSDAVNVQYQIRPLSCDFVISKDGHFLRYGKIIIVDMIQIPIDIMHGLAMSIGIFRSLPTVAKERINLLVNLIKRISLVIDLAYEFIDGNLNLVIAIPALFQIRFQQLFLDRCVIDILQIAEIGVAKVINQPVKNSILQFFLSINRCHLVSSLYSQAHAAC